MHWQEGVAVLAGLTLLSSALVGQQGEGGDEQRYVIGLRESIALSLSRNFTVRIDQLNPEKAKQVERRARGGFDPTLELTAERRREEILGLEGRGDRDSVSAIVAGALPWGQIYSLGVSSEYRERSTFDFLEGANSVAVLRVTQPLLRNRGRDGTYAAVRIAGKNREQAKLALRGTMMDTVVATLEAYYSLHFAWQNLSIAQTNRDLARQLLEDNRRRVEVGSMASADVMVAETRFALRKELVLVAEGQLREAENRLKQLVSDSVGELMGIRFRVKGMPEAERFEADARRDIEVALDRRPDYQRSLLGLEIDRIEVERDRDERLPRLDLVGSVDFAAEGGSLEGGLGNLDNGPADSYSLRTVFSMPIPNRSRDASYEISKIEMAQTELALEQLRQLILLRLDNAAYGVRVSWDRIGAAREARELAERSLEAEEKKLQAGASNSFFVLELQGDLANAQIRELGAITDYQRALARYELERGTILEEYGIETY